MGDPGQGLVWPELLAGLLRHEDLDEDRAAEVMQAIMRGDSEPSQVAGLLVALVVAALFVSHSLSIDLAAPITITFVIALLSLAAGLIYFLREVILSTGSLTFGGVRPRPPVAKQ